MARTICKACKGTGICDMCDGTGIIVSQYERKPQYYEYGEKRGQPKKCNHCKQTGKCMYCNGTGYRTY